MKKEIRAYYDCNEPDALWFRALVDRFVKGRPVVLSFTDRDLKTESPETSWRGRKLYVRIHGPRFGGFMLSHDLGHVFDATDEEMRLPNLGMTDVDKEEPRRGEAYREATVAAAQEVMAAGLGGRLPDRIFTLAPIIFGGKPGCTPKEWTRRADQARATLTFEKVAAELDRKLALIPSGNKVPKLVTV